MIDTDTENPRRAVRLSPRQIPNIVARFAPIRIRANGQLRTIATTGASPAHEHTNSIAERVDEWVRWGA